MSSKSKAVRKKYIKGRAFEYKIRRFFEAMGFYCVRSAGSHTDFDIVAIRNGQCIGIQCKASPNKLPDSSLEILAKQLGITTVFAQKISGNRVRLYFFKPNGEQSVREAVIKA